MATTKQKKYPATVQVDRLSSAELAKLGEYGFDRYVRKIDRAYRAAYPVGKTVRLKVGGNRGVRYFADVVDGQVVGHGKRYGWKYGVTVAFTAKDRNGGKLVKAFYEWDELDQRIGEAKASAKAAKEALPDGLVAVQISDLVQSTATDCTDWYRGLSECVTFMPDGRSSIAVGTREALDAFLGLARGIGECHATEGGLEGSRGRNLIRSVDAARRRLG